MRWDGKIEGTQNSLFKLISTKRNLMFFDKSKEEEEKGGWD
jgi:hypothetical protein